MKTKRKAKIIKIGKITVSEWEFNGGDFPGMERRKNGQTYLGGHSLAQLERIMIKGTRSVRLEKI